MMHMIEPLGHADRGKLYRDRSQQVHWSWVPDMELAHDPLISGVTLNWVVLSSPLGASGCDDGAPRRAPWIATCDCWSGLRTHPFGIGVRVRGSVGSNHVCIQISLGKGRKSVRVCIMPQTPQKSWRSSSVTSPEEPGWVSVHHAPPQ